MNKYNLLGLNIFKYNQAALFVFSLLLLVINYMISSSLSFWVYFVGMIIFINLIWYSFSDIKWNKDVFVIEKFMMKKQIPSKEFLKVERLFFNFFVIKFTYSKYYYLGNLNTIYQEDSDITSSIKLKIF